jgi:hypothetical protein
MKQKMRYKTQRSLDKFLKNLPLKSHVMEGRGMFLGAVGARDVKKYS